MDNDEVSHARRGCNLDQMLMRSMSHVTRCKKGKHVGVAVAI